MSPRDPRGILDDVDFGPLDGDSSGNGGSFSFSDKQPESHHTTVDDSTLSDSHYTLLDIAGAFAIDPDEDGVTQQDAGKRRRIFGRTNHGHREIVCDKCLLPFTYSKHSRAWH